MQADTSNTSRFQSSAFPCQPLLHRLHTGTGQFSTHVSCRAPQERRSPTERPGTGRRDGYAGCLQTSLMPIFESCMKQTSHGVCNLGRGAARATAWRSRQWAGSRTRTWPPTWTGRSWCRTDHSVRCRTAGCRCLSWDPSPACGHQRPGPSGFWTGKEKGSIRNKGSPLTSFHPKHPPLHSQCNTSMVSSGTRTLHLCCAP